MAVFGAQKGMGTGSKAKILIFAGCMARYDLNVHRTLEHAVQWLSGLGFTVIALENETCCGESMRKLGNEMGFVSCRDKNLEAIEKVEHDVILTICPHCAQTLKQDYATYKRRLNVRHIWEFAAEQIDWLSPKNRSQEASGLGSDAACGAELMTKNHKRVLHMPCLLGKTPGSPADMVEMAKTLGIECPENVVRSHCCGAGGGQFFIDAQNGLVKQRVDELMAYDADEIVTGCPFCAQMLGDELIRRNQSDCGEQQGKNCRIVHIADLLD
jgi:Fe-S oxidoreductase